VADGDSWTGHGWRLAGCLTRLHSRGLLGPSEGDGTGDRLHPFPIVVLVPSARGKAAGLAPLRHIEYRDVVLSNLDDAAYAHADHVTNVLLPLVDRRYRTSGQDVFAAGASLGGVAAFNMVWFFPERYEGFAAMSPAFGPGAIGRVVASAAGIAAQAAAGGGAASNPLAGKRIYLDNGGDADVPEEEEATVRAVRSPRDGGMLRGLGGSLWGATAGAMAEAASSFGRKTKRVTVPTIDIFDHLTDVHWWNPGYFWLDTQLQPSIDGMRLALDALSVAWDGARLVADPDNNTNMGRVEYAYHRQAGGRHNERAWSRRIHLPMMHLLGGGRGLLEEGRRDSETARTEIGGVPPPTAGP